MNQVFRSSSLGLQLLILLSLLVFSPVESWAEAYETGFIDFESRAAVDRVVRETGLELVDGSLLPHPRQIRTLAVLTGPAKAWEGLVSRSDIRVIESVDKEEVLLTVSLEGQSFTHPFMSLHLSSNLLKMQILETAYGEETALAYAEDLGYITHEGRINVYIDADTPDLMQVLEVHGFTLESEWFGRKYGWVDISRMRQIAREIDSGFIGPCQQPTIDTPSTRDAPFSSSTSVAELINAGSISCSASGQGITVAVIDKRFAGLSDAVNSGHVSSDYQYRNFVYGQDQSLGDFEAGDPTSFFGSHGTRCAELICDLVPDATLWLFKVNSEAQFLEAINYGISKGVNVYSISIDFHHQGWADNEGPVCASLGLASDNGAIVVSAVGNAADRQYVGGPSQWSGSFHEWQPGVRTNPIRGLGHDETLSLFMHWPQSNLRNLRLSLYADSAATTELVTADGLPHLGAVSLEYTNPHQHNIDVYVAVRSSWPFFKPADFDLRIVGDRFRFCSFYGVWHTERSVNNITKCTCDNKVNVGGVLASMYADANPLIYYRSGRGPTKGGLVRPTIVAPTGVPTSIGQLFYGTSASAPIVAGALALMLSHERYASTTEVIGKMYTWATLLKDWGEYGMDNTFGHGGLILQRPAEVSGVSVGGVAVSNGGQLTRVRVAQELIEGVAFPSVDVHLIEVLINGVSRLLEPPSSYQDPRVQFYWNTLAESEEWHDIEVRAHCMHGHFHTYAFSVYLEDPPEGPYLNVTPGTLFFSGMQNGAHPPTEFLSIENLGGGSMPWTISESIPWLTMGLYSGTGPYVTSASVNTTGLSLGTHTGVLTVTAPGAGGSPVLVDVSVTISPSSDGDTFHAVADTYVAGSSTTQNFGHEPIMLVGSEPHQSGGYTWDYGMVRFDMSGLLGKVIDSATFRLYCTTVYSGSETIIANRMGKSWQEYTATFQNLHPMSWYSPNSERLVSGPGWVEFDATAMVQAWASGSPNDGFLVRSNQANGNFMAFSTKEGSQALRPVLEVVVCEGGVPDVVVSVPTLFNGEMPPFFVGQEIDWRVQVMNNGSGCAPEYRIDYYLGVTAQDQSNRIRTSTGSSLMPGETHTKRCLYTLQEVDRGTRYLIARVRDTNNASVYGPFQVLALPVLSVAPTYLEFSAVEHGANPHNTMITIANEGEGMLPWTASVSAPWLSVVPETGVNAGTPRVYVDIAGLEAGIYNGSVEVVSQGVQGSPAVVEVQLTVHDRLDSPPAPAIEPEETCEGSPVTVSWESVDGASTYRLFKNGQQLGEDFFGTGFLIQSAQTTDAGVYSVAAGNHEGWSDPGPTTQLVVYPVPAAPSGVVVHPNPFPPDTEELFVSWNPVGGASSYEILIDGTPVGNASDYPYATIAPQEGALIVTSANAECAGGTSDVVDVVLGEGPQCFVFTSNTGSSFPIAIANVALAGGGIAPGDEIGVFDGSLCVGAGIFQGSFPLQLVAWGNNPDTPEVDGFAPGNEISLVLARASECQLVSLCPDENGWIDSDGTFGHADGALVALTDECCREATVTLNEGWNYLSFNTEPDVSGVMAFLAPVVDAINIVRQCDGQFAIPGVIDLLGPLDILSAYAIHVSEARQFAYCGEAMPVDSELVLSSGWNCMGYPCVDAVCVEAAMATIEDCVNICKAPDGSFYIPGLVNTLGSLTPGAGYKVHLSCPSASIQPCLTKATPGQLASGHCRMRPTHFVMNRASDDYHAVVFQVGENIEVGDEIGLFGAYDRLYGSGVYEGSDLALAAWAMDEFAPDLHGYVAGERIHVRVWRESASMEVPVAVTVVTGSPRYGEGPYTVLNISSREHDHVGLYLRLDPNPFLNEISIQYSVPMTGLVDLRIFDATGRQVRTLLSLDLEAGVHHAAWDGLDNSGRQLPSGTYFCRLEVVGEVLSKRVTLLR